MARVWVGTSGWNYKHWVGEFYPRDLKPRDWFAYYAEHYPTVEINASFYREPANETYDSWAQQAPPGFRFAVKAHRFLTHLKRLIDPADPLERVVRGARRLGEHLGPILYQMPPGFRRDARTVERLEAFLDLLPADLDHAMEFRHSSWWTDDTLDRLRRKGVAFCWHDMGGADVPLVATAPFVYLRFHGGEKKYAGNYPVDTLATHARRIEKLLRASGARLQPDESSPIVDDAWIYFNNDVGGHAVRNAKTLAGKLGAPLSGVSRPQTVTA